MNRIILLGGIILLGAALRFFMLNAVPLRGDEAFTVLHWMREPLAQTLSEIATVDPQAPLSYLLYRGWGLTVGMSEYTARLLPALVSVLGIAAMYALAHRLRGARFGLLAAFFWAINPYQIWHAQDARSYAVWAVLSLLALWLALRALDRQRRIDWLLYVAAGTLAAYVYYLEVFVIVALNLYVLATRWRDRRLLVRWFGSQVAIGLLLAPWYLQPRLLTGSGYGGTGGSFDPAQWLTRFVPTLTFGDNAAMLGGAFSLLIVLLCAGLLAGLALWWRRNRQQALLFALLGTTPLLLLGIVATRLNVFEPRYVLAAAPAYVLVLAFLAAQVRPVVLRGVLGSAVVAVSLFTLVNYYFIHDYAKARDWRALASYLSAEVREDDWVTQAAADVAFILYCEDYAVARVCNDQLPANPNQSRAEIEQVLAERSAENRSVWYVAAPPPNWENAAVAQGWLDGQMQRVRDTSTGGLRVQQFMRWEIMPGEPEAEPLARFGGIAELVGVEISAEPNADLNVLLYWRALDTSGTSLKIFLHLLDENGLAAQDDQYPQDGRIETTTWETGTVYRDVYRLPLEGVAPGRYALVVGWYAPESNRRLVVSPGDGDSYTIQSVDVTD